MEIRKSAHLLAGLFLLFAFGGNAFAQNEILCASPLRIYPSYIFGRSAEGKFSLSISGQDMVPLECAKDFRKLPVEEKVSCSSRDGHWAVELQGADAQVYKVEGETREPIRSLGCQEIEPTPEAKVTEALRYLTKKKVNPSEVIQALGAEKWQVVVPPFNRAAIPAGVSYDDYITKTRRFPVEECLFRTSKYLIKVSYCMEEAWRKFHQMDLMIYGKGVSLFYRVAGGRFEIDPETATVADLDKYDDVSVIVSAKPKFASGNWNRIAADNIIGLLQGELGGNESPFKDQMMFSLRAQRGMKQPECTQWAAGPISSDVKEVVCPKSLDRTAGSALALANKPAKASLKAIRAYVEATVRAYTEAGLPVKDKMAE